MVNLPGPLEQAGRSVTERRSDRSQIRWGTRYGRRRNEVRERMGEPSTLMELHEQAKRTVQLMEKHGATSENNYERALLLLRMQHNLEFLIRCHKCGGMHQQDELMAPER